MIDSWNNSDAVLLTVKVLLQASTTCVITYESSVEIHALVKPQLMFTKEIHFWTKYIESIF